MWPVRAKTKTWLIGLFLRLYIGLWQPVLSINHYLQSFITLKYSWLLKIVMNCFTHRAHLSWNKCSHAPLSKQETDVQQQRLNLNSESVKTSNMSEERVKEKTSNQHLWAPNNLQWIYNTKQFTACGFLVTKCEDGWHSLTNLSVHPSKCLSLHWEGQRVQDPDKSRRQIYRCEQVCKWEVYREQLATSTLMP